MAGGLIMYFQGLESLEDNLRTTSASELQSLVEHIHFALARTQSFGGVTKRYGYSTERFYTNSSEDWGNITRSVLFAAVGSSRDIYGAGVVVVPYNSTTNPRAFYSHIWADPLANGDREYVHGVYGDFLPNDTYFPVDWSAQPPEVTAMQIKTSALYPDTGLYNEYRYVWDAKSYVTSLLQDWDPRDGGLPPGGLWIPGVDGSVAMRWRRPGAWYSSDETPYVYAGVDMVFVPPPPPHPWHAHKAVIVSSLFDYQSWENVVHDFGLSHQGTTLVVVDAVSRILYASTTGQRMIDPRCFSQRFFSLTSPLGCATKVVNTSATVQDAVAVLTGVAYGVFKKSSLDGEDHYLRKAYLHNDVEVIWMRPVSSVQGKVQEALTLLIIFTALVLAFDATISICEVIFIAMPMRRLAKSIVCIGRMETSEAAAHIQKYQDARVMVHEMRTLMEGMGTTVSRLAEYKAFMPEAVLQGSDGPGVDPPEGDVSLVFTDIVRSTELWEAVPEAMAVALDLHNKAMRRCIQSNGGYEVKTIGDAFMVAFQSPADAVSFACDVQAALVQEAWPDDLLHFTQSELVQIKGDTVYCGLRVRMGAHFGHAEIEINPLTERADYRGSTVNKAARIEPQALPGMVALSSELHDAIKSKRSEGAITFHTLGTCNLKGIGDVALYYALTDSLRLRQACFDFVFAEQKTGADTKPRVNELLRGVPRTASRIAGMADRLSGESPTRPRGRGDAETVVSVQVPRERDAGLDRKIMRVVGAFACVRLNRLDEALHQTDEPPRVLALLNELCQAIVDCAVMTEGTVETLMGANATVSWNCTSRCLAYNMQALRFTGFLQRRQENLHTGLACGPLLHGLAGSTSRKYHTVMGVGASLAQRLVDSCPTFRSSALVVVGGGVTEDFAHASVPVAVWPGKRFYGNHIVVEHVLWRECTELRGSWGDDPDAVVSEAGSIREAVMASLAAHTTEPLEELRRKMPDNMQFSRVVDHMIGKEGGLVTKVHQFPHPHSSEALLVMSLSENASDSQPSDSASAPLNMNDVPE